MPSTQPSPLLDAINAADTASLGDWFYTSAAKAKGVVKVRPADIGWEDYTLSADKLEPAETDPADIDEAMRWCVVVDDIPECEAGTAALVYLERETGSAIIAALSGPAHDHDVAIRMVARDLKAEQRNAPARKTLRETVPLPKAANDNRPATAVNAQSLLSMDFPPVVYVVPGVITEGLTILGGRPKLGKSWLALGVCIAVATGGAYLGAECERGDVLYLALEDNKRRLQGRLTTLLPPMKSLRPDLSQLELDTEAPTVDGGLIQRLDAWRLAAKNPRLVVIDTLAMVRPAKKRTQDSYEADYAALSPLQRWSGEHGLAVVVVTHVRKMEASDPLEMISGTNGLTGAADSILVLNRDADGPKLYGRGRDIEELEKALRFDNGRWSVLGDVDEVKRSAERRAVLAALDDAVGPMTPAEIAKVIGKPKGNLNVLLTKMVKDGEVVKVAYGLYAHPGKTGKTGKTSKESNHSNQSNVGIQKDAA
ncbi:MAG: AAA family ATPase [Aquamicrobium sp.]|uniref:AAA family ATPase n=1 Tax=Aquamicrobium sp. TaxID=1872579 RepID=UPI00349EAD45|nr:AAA family ATPase [Aquamicrobium sp.]MCO5158967.1 AAA family ATPase [Aquamicrobium sp.]